jgi:hypothetical protein
MDMLQLDATTTDLQREPLALNERWRVTADGLQWIVQKRRKRGTWGGAIFCQTKAGLLANLGYEVYGVGAIDPDALTSLKLALPRHRRLAPGWTGPDVEAEIARARAQDKREAVAWMRKTGGRQEVAA